MKKLLLLFALLSHSLFAITIIGSPNVEINPEGLYLVKVRISSTSNLREDDIIITNFKSVCSAFLLLKFFNFQLVVPSKSKFCLD